MENWDLADFWEEFEREVRDNLQRLEEGFLNLEERPDDKELVNELMRLAHTVKGSARLMGVEDIAAPAAEMETLLRSVREGQAQVTSDMITRLLNLLDALRQAMGSAQKQHPQADATTPQEPAPADQTSPPLRESPLTPTIDPQQTEELTALSTVIHVQHMRLRDVYRQLDRLTRIGNAPTFYFATVADPLATKNKEAHQEWFNQLLNVRDGLRTVVEDMELTLQTLESEILRMRLVPFDVLLPVIRRTVRDVAQALGKRVQFHAQGTHTRIDRHLVGPLQDALIHLLRNAVDHGIESEEERVAQGKPPEGHITLRVETSGSMVLIHVEDDGRGIQVEKVRAKAIERGILSPEDAENLSEHELLQVLFHPGFTTRSQVTTFSGQGVGLNAVAEIVRRLGGDVEVHTQIHKGTRITLRVPLNIALVEALLIQIGDRIVALPVARVAALLRSAHTRILPLGKQHVVHWRDMLVPRVHLETLFPDLGPVEGRHIIILRSAGRYVAATGGTVLEHTTLAMHPLPAVLYSSPYVYGASILGDGSVVYILAGDAIAYLNAHTQEDKATDEEGENGDKPRILVVDDGPTTRELMRTILTAAGYQVITAEDGEDALQKLVTTSVDAIVTDVQMPRMDGISLIRRLRADSRWKDVPIIIVSIQSGPDDIQRGLEAGANAYVTKQDFEEGTLLDVMERVLT